MQGYKTQLASNVIKDGMSLELLDRTDNIVAEIFRCDADHTVSFSGNFDGIPMPVRAWFMALAREKLDPFEDGVPLTSAWPKDSGLSDR